MPEKYHEKCNLYIIIREVSNAKNIYVCDSSRMGYISSLPHTFTSMAIADVSMPFIINKINDKTSKD